MAYYSLHAYDADVRIPGFAGLQQYGAGMDGNVSYAVEEKNAETPGGVLQPMASPEILSYSFNSRIETLMHMYRRWYSGNDRKEVLFAALGGKLYYLTSAMTSWTQLSFPTGVSAYQSNVWSWVTYEINPQGSTNPVDVLLLSNAKDGMIMVRGDNFSVSKVTTPHKFGVIERYAERIWGGAIDDEPDMLVYSAPFDPTDWTANTTIPEDGAGDISQPSWDGDSFTALKSFGSQLIAFKSHRVWRVLGTDPGEYTFKEQYGGGAPYANTIAVDTERILFAEKDGLSVYDGLAVNPSSREAVCEVWKTVNKGAIDQICGALYDKRYYLAFPTGTSTVNNALLIYNFKDGNILYFDSISIESFLPTEDKLYATSSTLPGKILILNWDSWTTGTAASSAVRWVTPWMTLEKRNVKKGGFDLYMQPEVKDSPVTFTISVQTEKKVKSKKYTAQPLSAMEQAAGKNHRVKKLHFGGSGRRFRVIIEAPAGTAPWRLTGGLHLIVETDPD